MNITTLIVVIHVFSAFAMVAGVIGRELTRFQMHRTTDFNIFIGLLDMVGVFEKFLVIPAPNFVALSGIALAVLEGYPLFGFLQGGPVNWLLVSNLLVVSIILLIVFMFVPRGRQFEKIVAEAKSKKEIIPALLDFDRDPGVVWAHRWENIATGLIVFLMIAKPF